MGARTWTGNRGGTGSAALTLALLACLQVVAGQTNNTLDPVTKKIAWGTLAPDKAYKSANYVANDGGLGPYYALAVSYIGSCLPEKLPVDTVSDLLNGRATIADKWQPLAKDFVGYALSLAIGLIFIFVFPIVGCCFCCCRLCGNCGGKRQQNPKDSNNSCKRAAFAAILAVLSLFVIAGAACTFVSSDQLTKNLGGLNTSFGDAIEDVNTFVDNIDAQFNRLGNQNFDFLVDTVANYVDDAKSNLADDIIALINSQVGLNGPLDDLSQKRTDALAYVATLDTQVSKLESQRVAAVSQLAILDASCTGCLNAYIVNMNGPYKISIQAISDRTKAFRNQVSTDIFKAMKTELSTGIATAVNETTKTLNIRTELGKIKTDQIQPMLSRMGDLKKNLNSVVGPYQKTVDDLLKTIKPFDKYRWYAGLGLACLLVLIGLLLLLGVALGCLCGSAKVDPLDRGSASNCGGICIMSAVGLIFIFGALLMLLTTLMFLIGALTERYICQSIDHLERIEQYTKSINMGMDLSNLSFPFNGETINLSASGLMNGCKNEQTLYKVLNLKGIVNTSLSKIDEYKAQTLNKLNSIDASKAASNAQNAVNVTTEINQLKETSISVAGLQTLIQTLKGGLVSNKSDAQAVQSSAGAAYDPMITTCDGMISTCTSLKTVTDDIVSKATTLPATVQKTIDTLNNVTFMTTLVKTVTTNFSGTVFGFVNSYIGDITTKLDKDIGKCTPFYSIVHAILSEAFCHGIVDPLNGFWLALGWCLFFFMPSLIIGVKLAKYFRRMLYGEAYEQTKEGGTGPSDYYKSAPPQHHSIFPPLGSHNKVAPF